MLKDSLLTFPSTPIRSLSAKHRPASAADDFFASFIAIEQKRDEFEEKRANNELRKEIMEEIKTFSSMLTNPHLDSASKASVAALFATATSKSRLMDAEQAAQDAVQSGGGSFFTLTKQKQTSGADSSGSATPRSATSSQMIESCAV